MNVNANTRLRWREAVDELARRKLRTLLTLLGLVFGVGAIVAMQGVTEGSRREALRLVESLGLHNLIVEHKAQDPETLKETRARSLGLSVDDARAARAVVPGATGFAAEKRIRTYAVFSDEGTSDAQASAVSPDYFDLAGLHVAQGRALSADDDETIAAVAVLGDGAARALFPEGHALGKPIKINHVWLRVVGVLADRDLSKDKFEGVSLGVESNRIYIPLQSAWRFRFQPMEDDADRIILNISDPDELPAAARVLNRVLDQRHAGITDYSLIVPQQLYQQNQKIQHIFSIVMGAIAGVSLLVGGIGIMNIMLANILERRREIGLLRALGARRSDIIARFLREATVICTAGAVIGLVFGVLLAYLIAAFAGWQVAWSILPIAVSVVLCVGIGLAFSVYPARQAADLDPIAAIRDE
ncbi:ABC transporter permease [Dyella sp. GSA-30]|uniref:ABC transporter permease n=1 Tax=Dyella sp. GSA-30 TaxID=2994496 RepID=UPI002491EBA1|nr:ABC transporter permease [Dyella sp. GSA-30]BDU21592.1 ABC transporter permease [Dyella sp. GSA-30]